MTSPARCTTTRSPGRTPRRAISSRLCSVTLDTTTPPTVTGFNRPTGVSLPVRPNLNVDRLQRRLGPLSREFMRDCPARGLGDKAQPLLPVQPVDLVDHAVDIIRQLCALALDAGIMRQRPFRPINAHQQRRHWHAPCRNRRKNAGLGIGWQRAHLTPAMREEAQRTRRSDLGILLPQRPRRRIARVGEYLAALRLLLGIQRGKVGLRHIDLAPDFEDCWDVAAQTAAEYRAIWATLAVTSSPTVPSPRVAACFSTPSS